MKTLFLLSTFCFLLLGTGCIGLHAQRGGSAIARGASLKQSENPSQPSTQKIEDEETTQTDLPEGSKIEKTATTFGADGKPNAETRSTITVPAAAKQTTHKSSHVEQSIGASQKDSSRSLSVAFQAMRPVMYASIAFFLAAGVFAYFGWWTKAGIMAGIGVGMLVLAAVIPGHEGIIIGGAVIAGIIGVLLVLYVYYKGHHDAATAISPVK